MGCWLLFFPLLIKLFFLIVLSPQILKAIPPRKFPDIFPETGVQYALSGVNSPSSSSVDIDAGVRELGIGSQRDGDGVSRVRRLSDLGGMVTCFMQSWSMGYQQLRFEVPLGVWKRIKSRRNGGGKGMVLFDLI